MDHGSRKPGVGSAYQNSQGSLRILVAGPPESGRLAATGLGRPGKDSSASKEELRRISKDHQRVKDGAGRKPVTSPQVKPRVNTQSSSVENASERVLHKLKDDRERDILHQSLQRTRVPGGGEHPKAHHTVKEDREREILNQSLKRAKLTGGEVPKPLQRVTDREREPPQGLKLVPRPKGDNRERDTLNLKRTSVSDSKVRPEKPVKAKRPDGTKASSLDKPVKKDIKGLSELKPDRDDRIKSVGDAVKRGSVASDRKRPMGVVKAEDGKAVVQRSVTKIEPVMATSNSTPKHEREVPKEPLRSVKMVTGTVVRAKQEKKLKKQAFSLPGQRFEPPEERDALRLFYSSLHQQIPTSDMANIWLMEHGLLEADEAQKVLTQKVKSKTGVVPKGSPFQAPTLINGKTSKFHHEELLELKPVSKKLKL